MSFLQQMLEKQEKQYEARILDKDARILEKEAWISHWKTETFKMEGKLHPR
jgi:hypothetical protein